MVSPELIGVSLSLDSDEWYYGREEHRRDPSKRLLVKSIVPENAVVTARYAKEINEYFLWISEHEKDTAKKKKRLFYVDKSFFVNPNFSF